eukprot:2112606-Alexandrium_andersonii.AAC.1
MQLGGGTRPPAARARPQWTLKLRPPLHEGGGRALGAQQTDAIGGARGPQPPRPGQQWSRGC